MNTTQPRSPALGSYRDRPRAGGATPPCECPRRRRASCRHRPRRRGCRCGLGKRWAGSGILSESGTLVLRGTHGHRERQRTVRLIRVPGCVAAVLSAPDFVPPNAPRLWRPLPGQMPTIEPGYGPVQKRLSDRVSGQDEASTRSTVSATVTVSTRFLFSS